MKWTSHKLLTGAITFAITGNPITTALTTLGSVFPDVVEGFPSQGNYNSWRKRHRKLSHWFIPYLMAAMLCYLYSYHGGIANIDINHISFPDLFNLLLHQPEDFSTYFPLLAYLVSLFSLGALCHILQDMLCGKVPFLDPDKQEIGYKLFHVGSWQEYALVIPFSLLFIMARVRFG
ncbi:MAG: metal-dependent hydrolase [Flavobacteriales bacterium]|nr:metal-dependent hydrolase [Flavobacteriales bacterium]